MPRVNVLPVRSCTTVLVKVVVSYVAHGKTFCQVDDGDPRWASARPVSMSSLRGLAHRETYSLAGATGTTRMGGNRMSTEYDDNDLAAVAAELRAARVEQGFAELDKQAVELELHEALKVAYAAVRFVDDANDDDCDDDKWELDWQTLEELVAAWRPR